MVLVIIIAILGGLFGLTLVGFGIYGCVENTIIRHREPMGMYEITSGTYNVSELELLPGASSASTAVKLEARDTSEK